MTDLADPVRVTMLLCDHAAVAEGKLYVAGGGWTRIEPTPTPFGIAVLIEVPWTHTDRPLSFALSLVGEDGHGVLIEEAQAKRGMRIDGQVQVARPAGVRPGTAIPVPLAFSIPGMPLPAGQRLVWELSIGGETHEDWRLAFDVRDPQAAPG